MMGDRLIVGFAGLMLAGAACAAEVRYAIIQMDGAGHGAMVADSDLRPGDSVHVQYPDTQGTLRCCRRMSVGDFRRDREPELLAWDEIRGRPAFIYQVRVPKHWYEFPFIGLAAIGRDLHVRNAGEQLEVKDRQGRLTRARLCTSSEGVHLQQGAGAAPRTHLYLALGYTVEAPTCP